VGVILADLGAIEGAARRLIERNVAVGPGSWPNQFSAVMLNMGPNHERQSHHFRTAANEARRPKKQWQRCPELSNKVAVVPSAGDQTQL
jgi:hypothetical protein